MPMPIRTIRREMADSAVAEVMCHHSGLASAGMAAWPGNILVMNLLQGLYPKEKKREGWKKETKGRAARERKRKRERELRDPREREREKRRVRGR